VDWLAALAEAGHLKKRFAAALKIGKNEVGASLFQILNGVITGRHADSLKSCFAAGNNVAWCIADDENVVWMEQDAGMLYPVFSGPANQFGSAFGVRTEASKRKESI